MHEYFINFQISIWISKIYENLEFRFKEFLSLTRSESQSLKTKIVPFSISKKILLLFLENSIFQSSIRIDRTFNADAYKLFDAF